MWITASWVHAYKEATEHTPQLVDVTVRIDPVEYDLTQRAHAHMCTHIHTNAYIYSDVFGSEPSVPPVQCTGGTVYRILSLEMTQKRMRGVGTDTCLHSRVCTTQPCVYYTAVCVLHTTECVHNKLHMHLHCNINVHTIECTHTYPTLHHTSHLH